ncbi:MAG: hypothetical protein A2X25_15540 [Chloroflexi bacterium GWB2_49_20]|nr:MAG: hypothetical protein A2X25_15540 [Chloroflexi bacterium GWB2_49_20]OGN77480.1 MAG: hypothetical protein A2X26_13770 [Chloroflexi bacterium GWC2_49_37]OGN84816.1 MAG: hypothetical protein A2X27_14680 [Chloroflexi bacterium GWD2_49_16]HCC79261.1 hypothetical protein [Anaerolineae bacterium]
MKPRRLAFQLLSITLIISLTLGCGFLDSLTGTPDPNQELPSLPDPSTSGILSLRYASAADLADQITREDASLIQSFEAVQEALARAGIATVDVNGVYVAAYLPASPMPDTHPDVLTLTLEARDRENSYRMTVDEFAQALSDLGWPFSPDSSQGEQLIDFLAMWISAAGENPSESQSFTPLFMAEMAQHQIPAVDLSSGEADPSQAQLSLLELQLFSAAFDRIMIFPQTSIPPSSGGAHLASLSVMKTNSTLAQEDPCSKYKKIFYGPLSTLVLPQAIGQQLSDFGITYSVGEALGKVMEKYGMSGEQFGKTMAAVNVFARISKLIEIYSSLSVTVTVVGDNPVHKPLEGEPNLEVEFDAKVGVSDEDWKNYEQKYGEFGTAASRIAHDCLSTLGIPTLANTGDIAKAVEGFAVEWRITSGSPENGYDSDADLQDQNCSYHLGRLRCKLVSISDHSAKSSFRVDVIQSKPPETQAVHESGVLESSNMKVCAAVDASEAPSLSTFINGAMGGVGIADPIAELAGGMILKLGKPEGCTRLGVTYHVQKGWKVDGPFGETHIFGEICSGLEVPFTLNWDSSVGLAGTITFSPSSENGGVWSLEGAFESYVTNAGEGSYTIESSTGQAPTNIVIQNGSISQTTVGYGTITHPIGSPISIQLIANECPPP